MWTNTLITIIIFCIFGKIYDEDAKNTIFVHYTFRQAEELVDINLLYNKIINLQICHFGYINYSH